MIACIGVFHDGQQQHVISKFLIYKLLAAEAFQPFQFLFYLVFHV